jgi:hypothetical protein
MSQLNSTSDRAKSNSSRLIVLALFALAFLFAPVAAHADSNASYAISGTTDSGGTFSGTLNFDDTSSGVQITGSSFTIDGQTFACNGQSSNTCTVYDPFGVDYFQVQSGGSLVVLEWNSFNFDNPPPSFSFIGGYCLNCSFLGNDYIAGGSATPTPEPASWLLLLTGFAALAFFTRRRRNASLNLA